MSKVTWSVPLVQFGRCEIEFEDDGFIGYPEKFGKAYARFVADVMKGYEAEREKIAAELAKCKTTASKALEALDRIAEGDYEEAAQVLAEPTERKTEGYPEPVREFIDAKKAEPSKPCSPGRCANGCTNDPCTQSEPTERKTKVGDTVTVAGIEFTKVGDSPFPEHNEPTEEEAQQLIKEELGATVVGKTPVWDEPVQEPPKPWKGSGPVKKITDIQF